jgi:hypothetical protein
MQQAQIITVVDMPAGVGLTDQGNEAGVELRPFVRPANSEAVFGVGDRVDVVCVGAIFPNVTIIEIVTNKGGWVYVDMTAYGGYGFAERIGVAPDKVRAPAVPA